MVVKTRKQNVKDQPPQPNVDDRDRSPFVSPTTGKSRRAGKGTPFNSLLHNKNGLFPGFSLIRSKLGLTPSAFVKLGITLVLAALAGYLHWYHLSRLFENDRHFSHLSGLEKEMAFRTEMGLYYSYFKTIIEAPTFLNGLYLVMNDRLTEYPLVINTLKRFNLYPEVVLASWYRIYTDIMEFFGLPTKMCWSINRGEGMAAVDGCEGMGDPAYFYVTFVFLLNGLMMSLFFIYGTYLSGSRLGGMVTVLCFFFNHGESTRVMWTPPLRESFSYPFLVLQMLLLTHILRTRNPSRKAMWALAISNLCFMLPWQFAQFVLLTQVREKEGEINIEKGGGCERSGEEEDRITLAVCFVLMFGNSMLLTSFYASSLVSIWLHLLLQQFLSQAHISSLIKSKFTSYKDFDTMMYTCAAEFDFMEIETPLRYIKTLLLPINMLVVAVIAGRVKTSFVCHTPGTPHNPLLENKLVYHSLQLIAFVVLAMLIMRLKLFLTPHMCIMASLICSKQLFGWIGEKFKLHVMVFGILSIMAMQGAANLQSQWGIMGEFSNLPQEQLLDWIRDNTPPNSVFAGAMPTMASVKLSAGRPIVNHPHYEDAGLRERTKLVYAMYSRKSAEVVKRNLMQMEVDYFVLEDSWCTRRSRPGCSMPEIWDVEDPQNAGKVPLCTLMSRDSRPHFATVFHNNVYKVLKVPKATKELR
uniref:Probable C-mannosyltransferase DPY19L1 n=1 Tax=Oncorhynchus kisutch TaxID=8019 RepID=A0A8C7MP13_ONCKI